MYNLKIDEDTNDLIFDGQNALVLIDGPEEKAQQINRSLTTRLTEWFLNTSIGLDWDIVFDKPYRKEAVKSEIRRVLLEVVESEELKSLTTEFNPDTRRLDVRFVYQPNDGTEEIEGVVEIG